VPFLSFLYFSSAAIPKRKNNDEKLIYVYIGNIVYQIPRDYNLALERRKTKNLKIIIKETSLSVPSNVKSDDFQLLSKILIFDSGRNSIIAEDITAKAKEVYPFSFEGKLIQYIGRLEHSQGGQKMIYDYRDKNIKFLENLFKKRKRYYNKIS